MKPHRRRQKARGRMLRREAGLSAFRTFPLNVPLNVERWPLAPDPRALVCSLELQRRRGGRLLPSQYCHPSGHWVGNGGAGKFRRTCKRVECYEGKLTFRPFLWQWLAFRLPLMCKGSWPGPFGRSSSPAGSLLITLRSGPPGSRMLPESPAGARRLMVGRK